MTSATFVCEDDFDCFPNGSCGSDLRCLCDTGFYGVQCEDTCPIKCQNGGQCVVDDAHVVVLDARCDCPPDFLGGLCEQPRQNSAGALRSSQEASSNAGTMVGITLAAVAVSGLLLVAGVWRRRRLQTSKEFTPTEEEVADEDLPSVT
ncbi:unnamed protein product [Cylindrotheca closterium]|uniref:EGF-like domain-containing protein n=1 Tax=Cylindrotheca closterium TaxID=2856 RepID=A0AAD2JLJ5_9STRA|nr:unnamed protein product [Cylindrotheca closterium]